MTARQRKQIGARIQQLRRMHGMTQDALGESIGISGKYLSSIERGLGNCSLDVLLAIAASLDIEAYQLFLSPRVRQTDALHKALDPMLAHADPQMLQAILTLLERR